MSASICGCVHIYLYACRPACVFVCYETKRNTNSQSSKAYTFTCDTEGKVLKHVATVWSFQYWEQGLRLLTTDIKD